MHSDSFHPRVTRRRLVVVAAAAIVNFHALAADFREITWDELVPKDWDPKKLFKDLPPVSSDTDPRAAELYTRLREEWDNAPTVPALAGNAIRLPGYLVPLDEDKEGLREFLLVPYFGACIHTPPPPANQIVHVRSAKAIKGLRTMSSVMVSGTLGIERSPSAMGVSGYTMVASRVEAYRGK